MTTGAGWACPKRQFLTAAGAPNAAGTLYVYQTGTTTPVTIYSDYGLTTPITNPITLDANGDASFYVSGAVLLKLVSYDASNALVETIDPVLTVGGPATLPGNNTITNAILAQMNGNTVKVNNTGSAANATDLAMDASTILARLAAGNIVAATGAQVSVLIGSMTKTLLTTGTAATYTTPANCKQIVVKMVGAGGGGGASATNAGQTGGTTTFNSITAIGGGGGGTTGGQGGLGGTGGSGTAFRRVPGQGGGPGSGGASMLGLGAPAVSSAAGVNAAANTGGGGSSGNNGTANPGESGGGGEYVEIIIPSPAATYTYTITAGGAGGTAGTEAGGNGGSGVIIVEEYY